jgi:hypothetical protein
MNEKKFLKAKNLVSEYATKLRQRSAFKHDYLFAVIPREDRELNEAVAKGLGYFWLPCEICGESFAGYEWLDGHVIYTRGELGRGVCYKPECAKEAKKRSNWNPEFPIKTADFS